MCSSAVYSAKKVNELQKSPKHDVKSMTFFYLSYSQESVSIKRTISSSFEPNRRSLVSSPASKSSMI